MLWRVCGAVLSVAHWPIKTVQQPGWKQNMTGRVKLATFLSISLIACGGAASAQQQVIGAPPEASNMKLVGHNDLQARSAYQPTIHHQGDRWIAYIGHHGGHDAVQKTVNPLTGQAELNGNYV